MQRGAHIHDLLFADLAADVAGGQYHHHHHHHHHHVPRSSPATLQLLSSIDHHHHHHHQPSAPSSTSSSPYSSRSILSSSAVSPMERIERVVEQSAVVVFSVSSCCMCHVAKQLFCGMGVSPTVIELDEEEDAAAASDIEMALLQIVGGDMPAVPTVFVGGKLIGGLDRLMACHISGSLIPQLKEAGALWL